MDNSKACSKCQQVKSLEFFVKDKSKASGYKASCLGCSRIASKIGRLDGRHKIRKYADMTDAQKEKHLARYRAWAKANPDRCKSRNKAHRERNRAFYAQKQSLYRQNNPDKYKQWQKANPEKVLANWTKRRKTLIANGIFAISKKEITQLLQSPCFYCKSDKSGTIDHVVPLSKGGRHSIGNLLPACMDCNQRKSAMFLVQWRMRNESKPISETTRA
jgi:5-methylcytosine-specific restriction endonuclease McrA